MVSPSMPAIASQILRELSTTLDRLPYTPEFDAASLRFKQLSGKEFPPNEVWWHLLNARKRGLGREASRRRPSGD